MGGGRFYGILLLLMVGTPRGHGSILLGGHGEGAGVTGEGCWLRGEEQVAPHLVRFDG